MVKVMRNITPSRFLNRPKELAKNVSKKTSEKFKEVTEKVKEGLTWAVSRTHSVCFYCAGFIAAAGFIDTFYRSFLDASMENSDIWSNLKFNIGAGLQGFSAALAGYAVKGKVKTTVEYAKIDAMLKEVVKSIEEIEGMLNSGEFDREKAAEYIVYLGALPSLVKRWKKLYEEISPSSNNGGKVVALEHPTKYIWKRIIGSLLKYSVAVIPSTAISYLFISPAPSPDWLKTFLIGLPFGLILSGTVAGIAEGLKEVRDIKKWIIEEPKQFFATYRGHYTNIGLKDIIAMRREEAKDELEYYKELTRDKGKLEEKREAQQA